MVLWRHGWSRSHLYQPCPPLAASGRALTIAPHPGTKSIHVAALWQTWRDTWQLANQFNPPYVMIATWNDFEEVLTSNSEPATVDSSAARIPCPAT